MINFSTQIGIGYERRNRYDDRFYDPKQEAYVSVDSIRSPSARANKGAFFSKIQSKV